MGLIKPQCLETKLTYHLIKMPQTFWIFFERNQLTKNTFISGEFQKKKKKQKMLEDTIYLTLLQIKCFVDAII